MTRTWMACSARKPLAPGEVTKIQIPDDCRLARFIESRERQQPYSVKVQSGNELEFKNIGDDSWFPDFAVIIETGTGTVFDWPVSLKLAPGERVDARWEHPGEPFKLERINVHIPYRLPQDTLRLTQARIDQEDQMCAELPCSYFMGADRGAQLAVPAADKLRLDFYNAGDVPLEALVWLQGRMPLKREDPFEGFEKEIEL